MSSVDPNIVTGQNGDFISISETIYKNTLHALKEQQAKELENFQRNNIEIKKLCEEAIKFAKENDFIKTVYFGYKNNMLKVYLISTTEHYDWHESDKIAAFECDMLEIYKNMSFYYVPTPAEKNVEDIQADQSFRQRQGHTQREHSLDEILQLDRFFKWTIN